MHARKRNKRGAGAVLDTRMREQVELEVVSTDARLRLTRLLRRSVRTSAGDTDSHQIQIIRINKIVNLARTVLGKPLYTLELSDWDYEPAEYAWHNAELELAMRRPDTAQLVEILVDIAEEEFLQIGDINEILESDGSSIRVSRHNDEIEIEIAELADLPESGLSTGEHPNVRKLVERMDRAMQDRDWALVLHTGASIFETVAKQVVPNPTVQTQSLGGWFALYRKHSKLAEPLLDTVEAIFKRRNIEPLAGHGSPSQASITEEEAVQVRELAIAFVRLERTLANLSAAPALTLTKGRRGKESG